VCDKNTEGGHFSEFPQKYSQCIATCPDGEQYWIHIDESKRHSFEKERENKTLSEFSCAYIHVVYGDSLSQVILTLSP